jgi:hypothetical protein
MHIRFLFRTRHTMLVIPKNARGANAGCNSLFFLSTSANILDSKTGVTKTSSWCSHCSQRLLKTFRQTPCFVMHFRNRTHVWAAIETSHQSELPRQVAKSKPPCCANFS